MRGVCCVVVCGGDAGGVGGGCGVVRSVVLVVVGWFSIGGLSACLLGAVKTSGNIVGVWGCGPLSRVSVMVRSSLSGCVTCVYRINREGRACAGVVTRCGGGCVGGVSPRW